MNQKEKQFLPEYIDESLPKPKPKRETLQEIVDNNQVNQEKK
jgi:hypothetical protein